MLAPALNFKILKPATSNYPLDRIRSKLSERYFYLDRLTSTEGASWRALATSAYLKPGRVQLLDPNRSDLWRLASGEIRSNALSLSVLQSL